MDAIETEKIVTTAEMFEIFGNELKERNAEIKRLREALRLAGDKVARLAYKMPPPNEFAPQFVLLGLTIASEALKEKE